VILLFSYTERGLYIMSISIRESTIKDAEQAHRNPDIVRYAIEQHLKKALSTPFQLQVDAERFVVYTDEYTAVYAIPARVRTILAVKRSKNKLSPRMRLIRMMFPQHRYNKKKKEKEADKIIVSFKPKRLSLVKKNA
jgi:hypothetical protein